MVHHRPRGGRQILSVATREQLVVEEGIIVEDDNELRIE
jgi:hypothetical protein